MYKSYSTKRFEEMKTGKKQKKAKRLDTIMDLLERIEKLLGYLEAERRAGDDLLTIAETSELVKLSVSTIYSKVSRREIPASKVGKRLYFCRSEIMAWIKSGKRKTIPEIRSDIGPA